MLPLPERKWKQNLFNKFLQLDIVRENNKFIAHNTKVKNYLSKSYRGLTLPLEEKKMETESFQ